jgi:hypothetical protein
MNERYLYGGGGGWVKEDQEIRKRDPEKQVGFAQR